MASFVAGAAARIHTKTMRVVHLLGVFLLAALARAQTPPAAAPVVRLADFVVTPSKFGVGDSRGVSAASLTGVEQDFLYGAASLALASTALWSEQTAAGGTLVDQAPAAMSLFRGPMAADAKTLRSFLWADAVGCISTGTLVLKYVKDVRPVLAGCFGGGAVASLRYFVS